jgi:hypothetical protein
MKILSCVSKCFNFYPGAVDATYIAFTEPLRSLGHDVEHFDHDALTKRVGAERTGEMLLQMARSNGYDVILYVTSRQNPDAIANPIREIGRYAATVAWNCDDDLRWEKTTSRMAPYFTFMFTTYPHVYEQNRARFPHLRLSQWACLEGYGDFDRRKDLDFTFVGGVYAGRVAGMRALAKRAGLQVFGHDSGRVTRPAFLYWPGIRSLSYRIPAISGGAIPLERVHEIWNRSRISYSPMEAAGDPAILQIKGRVFEQGLSGTMLLCRHSPNLEMYYEPGKELVPFDDLDDCIEKVKFYLANETARMRIARAYRDRTRAEHMWTHRWQQMFKDIGLGA